MSLRKFLKDQKVFAKVRGYPPWPARIHAILDETPSKQKYQVYFYGTHETGNCKQDELFDYVEFKEKYGKGVKRKNFSEAMNEIEQELNSTSSILGTLTEKKDAGGAGTVSSDDNRRESTLSLPTPTVIKKNSTDLDSDNEGNLVIDEAPVPAAASKDKKKATMDDSSSTSSSPAIEITSRSGRKIKPKKYLDGQTDFTSPLVSKISKSKFVKDGGDGTGVVRKTSNCDETNLNNGSSRDQVELQWNNGEPAQTLVDKIDQCEQLPKQVKKDFRKSVKRKIDEVRSADAANENLELLKTEVRLLDADCRIKASLSLNGADCVECLRAMDEILELNLKPAMLTKHPEVVETVRKLKKYVGNVAQWRLSPTDEATFLEDAKRICSKAETIYNKFKCLFTVPNGKSFYDVYSSECIQFQQRTHSMSMDEIYNYVKGEPCP